MPRFSFVHAADLHLDSPFLGLGRLSEAHSRIAEKLRQATFKAFDSVVDLCIRQMVDFLLVAGDVYDGADRSLRAQLRFRDGLRRLNKDRIEAVELKDKRFQRPDDFDLRKHLAKSFGVYHGDGEVCVKVRFLPAVARYVEESTWHPSQKLTRQRDGSVIAEFTLDGTEEIKRWVMSFGKQAQVLEPQGLRDEITDEFREALVLQRRITAICSV